MIESNGNFVAYACALCLMASSYSHRLYRFQHGLETPIKLILTSTSGRVISVLRLLRCSCISMNRKDHFSGYTVQAYKWL